MIQRFKRFDDRATDFLTGRKVSPPMNERRICSCCGQRIVKGWIMDNGDNVGEDCEDIISRFGSDVVCFKATLADFAARWLRSTGQKLKPAISGYLAAI